MFYARMCAHSHSHGRSTSVVHVPVASDRRMYIVACSVLPVTELFLCQLSTHSYKETEKVDTSHRTRFPKRTSHDTVASMCKEVPS